MLWHGVCVFLFRWGTMEVKSVRPIWRHWLVLVVIILLVGAAVILVVK